MSDADERIRALSAANEALTRALDVAQNGERAHEALAKRLRAFFHNNPLPMWIYDRASLAFVEVNDAAVRHYGHSREEFASLTLLDIRPDDEMAELLRDVAAPSERGVARVWRHRKKDGSLIDVEITAEDFELDGRNARLVLANDVTERRRAEEALRKSEEQLRQAQKMDAVGRFAGGVAHDFNNVLSVVLSYSEMLLGDLGPDDPIRADLDEIRRAGVRAADLTRQLLTFSRQEVQTPTLLDLNEVVTGLGKLIGRLVGDGVELSIEASPQLDKVKADRGQVEQIIMNLVLNARDAMPLGGTLKVQTCNVDLDDRYVRDHMGVAPGPHVALIVTDSGVGMDPETQARIFEPFFTTKAVGKGTGLGLSVVFGIVKQSGGHIWVDSARGRGTRFNIVFPVVDASEALQPTRPTRSVRAQAVNGETILLVDDDDQVRAVARRILTHLGFTVLEAPGSGEALLLAERHGAAISLLVTDVVMPRMNGAQLAERLRKTWPELKVLFMSGYATDGVLPQHLLDTGAHFIQKPLTPSGLGGKVREILATPRK